MRESYLESEPQQVQIIESAKVIVLKPINTKEIFINIFSCTMQTVLGYLCLDIILAITIHFISLTTKTPIEQNGVGLAYSIIGMIVLPMGLGLNQLLNVHVAQALGNNKTALARTYLNLTIYAHFMYFIPLCGLLYLTKSLFVHTIQEDAQATADVAWVFLSPLIISQIFAIEFECFKTYMLACKRFTPFIVIHLTTTSLLVLWCYVFIIHLDMYLWGAGLGIIITEFLNCMLLAIYLKFSNDSNQFSGFVWHPLFVKEWQLFKAYLKSSIHIYADFFVFQLLTFLTVWLDENSFGAQIAFSNMCDLLYNIPMSISLALMTFIGDQMAQKQVKEAKKYSIIGLLIFAVFIVSLLLFLWFGKNIVADFYSGGKTGIIEEMLETFQYFLLGCMVVDGTQGTLTGILKGLNKSRIVTISTFVSYYLIGIPFIIVLTFDWGVGLGLKGIWLGFGIANATLLIFYIILIIRTDWNKQAQVIEKQVQDQNKLQKTQSSSSNDKNIYELCDRK
ncbi:hypothetical protein pb186bvf_009992 [Paramecium bursaria]